MESLYRKTNGSKIFEVFESVVKYEVSNEATKVKERDDPSI